MNSNHLKELDKLIQLNVKKHQLNDDKAIKIKLLKETARQMILWASSIKEKGLTINIKSNILFDVAYVITGKKVELPKINDLTLSYFDRLFLGAYFNWKEHKDEIQSTGYVLGNPYIPYIEIFKRGGSLLKYEYTRLEIYPFIGVNVHDSAPYYSDKKLRGL